MKGFGGLGPRFRVSSCSEALKILLAPYFARMAGFETVGITSMVWASTPPPPHIGS